MAGHVVDFRAALHLDFFGGPYIEVLIGNISLNAALSAITAAVVGVILNLAVWFALHTLFGRLVEYRFYGMTFGLPVLAR
jgi:chromate transporter